MLEKGTPRYCFCFCQTESDKPINEVPNKIPLLSIFWPLLLRNVVSCRSKFIWSNLNLNVTAWKLLLSSSYASLSIYVYICISDKMRQRCSVVWFVVIVLFLLVWYVYIFNIVHMVLSYFVLFWFCKYICRLYPYSSGLFYCNWGSHMSAKRPCVIAIDNKANWMHNSWET